MSTYNIKKFLFCFCFSISLAVSLLLLFFLHYNDKAYKDNFNEGLNQSLEDASEKISRNVVAMCNLIYLNNLRDADGHLTDLHSSLSAYGDISVVNEYGSEYTYSELSFESNPVLKFGNLEIKNTEDIDGLLNNIKGNAPCDFAIYLRINADADLLNLVSTSSSLSDIYTPENVIFRVGEDGRESKIINSLLLNESVDEIIALSNTYVYIRYIPIMTSAETPRFIGALAYYTEEKNLNRIYLHLKNRHIKESGYYWIMEDLNNGDYRYKLSMGSEYDGVLFSEKEISQKEKDYIASLTINAKFLRSGESTTDFIDLADSSDTALVSYLYFEPWNWIIGTTVFKKEMQKFSSLAPSFGSVESFWIALLFIIIIVVAFFSSYYLSKPITNFFNYTQRNFGKNKKDDLDERFKSIVIDFDLFVSSLQEAVSSVNTLSFHIDNSKESIEYVSKSLTKGVLRISDFADKQCKASSESDVLINSMYSLSEKLRKFSEDFKVDAKNTLTFTRQKAQNLKALRKESELLKDIGGGFSSRFLRVKNIIEKLNAQLGDLKNYADKTKQLGENMESEIKQNDGSDGSIFSLLVEDTNSFYSETAISIVTMRNFLEQMKDSIDSTISEMRDFLNLIENGIVEIDDILEKVSAIIEQIATQQSRFQEISRGATMQSEAILQVLKIINEVKRSTQSTKLQISGLEAILEDLESSYKKLN